MTTAVVVRGTGMGRGAETGSGQAFLEDVGLIAMDSNRRLSCLSQNPTLNLEVIFFFSSSSQIIGGTTQSTPVSGSSLENEEDKDDEEDGDVEGGVLAL